MNKQKIILFGGNGFVGTAIAEQLVNQGLLPVCVSRTGSMPEHLTNINWAQQAEWRLGDALNPDPKLFSDAMAVVTLVGSPPVPTFSKKAYAEQLAMNSEPNLAVIAATANSSITRLVLLGAELPQIITTDKFGYAKGKRLCEDSAREFSAISGNHSAVLLKPTGIYGTRYSDTGKATNLATAMRPIAKLQAAIPASVSKFLPATLVSVESVANAAVSACLDDEFIGGFTVISNKRIVEDY